MYIRIVFCLCAVLIALAAMATALAGVPQLINYQGALLHSNGDPVTTPTSVVFTIYADSTGGNSKWTETRTVSPDAQGLFNIIVGQSVPIDDSVFIGPNRYLGIAVAGDPEMAPRSRLSSVPWAHCASRVEGFSPGPKNVAEGLHTFVGGDSNTVIGDYGAIAGGFGNYAEAVNFADTIPDTCSGISLSGSVAQPPGFKPSYAGGPCYSDDPLDPKAPTPVVYGGTENIATGIGAGILTGSSNRVPGALSIVTGGCSNDALGAFSFIGGGQENTAGCGSGTPKYYGDYSFVGGGRFNVAQGFGSVIGGGWFNTAGFCST